MRRRRSRATHRGLCFFLQSHMRTVFCMAMQAPRRYNTLFFTAHKHTTLRVNNGLAVDSAAVLDSFLELAPTATQRLHFACFLETMVSPLSPGQNVLSSFCGLS